MKNRIKEIIKKKNMTQIDLAKKLGIEPQTLRSTLSRNVLTVRTLERISIALEVPFYELFVTKEEILREGYKIKNQDNIIVCPECGARLEVNVKKIN